jgi:multiple sugar transport system permease protein
MRSGWRGYLFIAPWLAGFLLFTLWPFVASLGLSFCRYDAIAPPRFIGGANYVELVAHDPLFWRALANTAGYAAAAVPLSIATGFGLALLLNLELRGIAAYRTLFVLPHIVPVVATSVVFLWVLNPQIGLVNAAPRCARPGSRDRRGCRTRAGRCRPWC